MKHMNIDEKNITFINKDNQKIHFKDLPRDFQFYIVNNINKVEKNKLRSNKILKIFIHILLFLDVFTIVLSIYKNLLFNLILSTIATYIMYNVLNNIDEKIEIINEIIELNNSILKEIESNEN